MRTLKVHKKTVLVFCLLMIILSAFFAIVMSGIDINIHAASSDSIIDLTDTTATGGTGWTYTPSGTNGDEGVYTIENGADVTVTGNGGLRRVSVKGTVSGTTNTTKQVTQRTAARITLEDVTLDHSASTSMNGSPIHVWEGGDLTLILQGENVLKGGSRGSAVYAGLGVVGKGRLFVSSSDQYGSAVTNATNYGTLIIEGTGSLNAVGGSGALVGAAGIGGSIDITAYTQPTGNTTVQPAQWCGNAQGAITINGGTITATGGNSATTGTNMGGGAGIGSAGGSGASGAGNYGGFVSEAITINGGTVIATGGNGRGTTTGVSDFGGAGIGSGGGRARLADDGSITINGGTINANGGANAAGIGAGGCYLTTEQTIPVQVNGGFVTATGGGTSVLGILSPGRTVGNYMFGMGVSGSNDTGLVIINAINANSLFSKTRGVLIVTGGDNPGTYWWPTDGTANVLTDNVIIPSGATLTIHDTGILVIPNGVTLTNNGEIVNNGALLVGGTFINNGTLTGNEPEEPVEFGGGDGTAQNPYIISTAKHLNHIRNDLTAHYKLTANIDLNIAPYNTGAGWIPIGGTTGLFTGTLDGNGYTISNLYINTTASHAGLFRYLYTDAKICNLGLENVAVTGSGNYVGAFAGSLAENSVIEQCYSTGSITIASRYYAGGLVGSMSNSSKLSNCWSGASVRHTNESSLQGVLGGLVGNVNPGYQPSRTENDVTIEYCYSTGAIGQGAAADGATNGGLGGIVGRASVNNGKLIVTNCMSLNVSFATFAASTIVGYYTGGTFDVSLQIIDCYSLDKTTVNGAYNQTMTNLQGTPVSAQTAKTLAFWSDAGFDMTDMATSGEGTWVLTEDDDYPQLQIFNPLPLPSIESAVITLSQASGAYNGQPHTPTVSAVSLGGQTLTQGTDFTVNAITDNINAGTVTITLTGINGYKGTATATYTITSKTLSWATNGVAQDKTYNGSTAATITVHPTLNISGIVGSDIVTVSNGTAAFASATSGTGIAVIASGYSLIGADAENYTIEQPVFESANINKYKVTIMPAAEQSKTYGESDPTSYTYGIDTEFRPQDNAYSGSIGRETGENAGTYNYTLGTLAFSVTYAVNYEFVLDTTNKFEITKADQSAPAAPTVSSKTATSITLTEISGAEYRLNTGTWQSSPEFTGLTPATGYTFYARLADDENHNASPESAASTVITTDAVTLSGTVTISGTAQFGQTLTAIADGLSSTPIVELGTLTYQWKRGNVNIGTNSATYTITKDDIGQTITVTVTAANCGGSVTSAATATVAKASQAPPEAPHDYAVDATTIMVIIPTYNPNLFEFRIDGGTWQDNGGVFEGLSPNTQYKFEARFKETDTHAASSTSEAAYYSTDKAALSGSVTISGTTAYGQTLTANTSGLTSTPTIPAIGTVSYQWNRNDINIVGATGATYILAQDDIGQAISVTVTAANCSGLVSSNPTAAISKADQSAPAAPTVSSKTTTSITLTEISGAEYRLSTGTWQSSPVFTGLTPETDYTFYARLAATSNYNASAESSVSATITTDAITLGGSVTITGTAQFGQTLTANTDGLSSSPSVTLGALTYQWKRGNVNIGTNSATYTITNDDIGQTITVTVTAANCSGSVTSQATTAVSKAEQAPPEVPQDNAVDATTIMVIIPTYNPNLFEFRIDGGAWQDNGGVFEGLSPNTQYKFEARFKETETHAASTASEAAYYSTDKSALSGSVTISGTTAYGQTLTANTSGLTSTPTISAIGTISYQWKRNDIDIVGATGATYTLVLDDIGQAISVTVTAANCSGLVSSNPTAAISKADQSAPALDYSVSEGSFSKTITITLVQGAEYRFNNGAWSESNTYTSNAAETITLSIRYAETDTHFASNITSMQIDTSNQNQQAPSAFVLSYTANGDTDYTVTIPWTDGAEYSFDGETWSDNNIKENCLPGASITGYMRMAAKPGYNASGATLADITLPLFKVATLSSTPDSGAFTDSVSVTLSTATDGAVIYYTVDGTMPNTGSILYSGAFTLTVSTTVKAFAVKDGMQDSEVLTVAFELQESSYTVIVTNGSGGGTYAPDTIVTITANTAENGKEFDKWITADGVIFADANSTITTFIMPDNNVTVTAVYKDVTVAPSRAVTSGDDGTWNKDTDDGFTISVSGDFDADITVKVDGNQLTADDYTVTAGSTIITIKKAYLDTLSTGEHTIEILFTDSTVISTSITIIADNAIKPNRLSGGAIAGIVIGSVAAIGLIGFAVYWFAIKKKSFADLFKKN